MVHGPSLACLWLLDRVADVKSFITRLRRQVSGGRGDVRCDEDGEIRCGVHAAEV